MRSSVAHILASDPFSDTFHFVATRGESLQITDYGQANVQTHGNDIKSSNISHFAIDNDNTYHQQSCKLFGVIFSAF